MTHAWPPLVDGLGGADRDRPGVSFVRSRWSDLDLDEGQSTVATDRLRWDAASLPAELLESIRQYETCTIADAIEHCGVRPRNEGFTRPGLCCLTQGSPRSLGYAATYRVRYPDRTDCWAPPETLPTPRIAIIEYLEKEPVGSVVGEVRVVILKAFSYEVDCAMISIFKNYYLFGQVIIDKTVILGGFNHKLKLNLEGKEHLLQMQDGGILISGHIGNWEVGGQVLNFLDRKINILVFDAEKQAIKNYMSDTLTKRNVNIIEIHDDFSHLFEIKNALENKEIIALHGDRFIRGNKTVKIPFLGKPALFPLGPWQMAAVFRKPVSFVFAVKETRNSYRFFATAIKVITNIDNRRNRDEMIVLSIKDYVGELEKMVRKYPLQWYNYYDFWKQ